MTRDRKPHAPPYPPRIANPSRRARKDRELPDRDPEGSPGGRGGERHRRRRHADESVSEEGEKTPRCRRDRVQVSRVRQLPGRVAPPPRAQDVDRLAHLSHGVREGRAHRRRGGSRAADREGRAGKEAVVREVKPPRRLRRHPVRPAAMQRVWRSAARTRAGASVETPPSPSREEGITAEVAPLCPPLAAEVATLCPPLTAEAATLCPPRRS